MNIDLDALEKLAHSATPGPWKINSRGNLISLGVEGCAEFGIVDNPWHSDREYLTNLCPETVLELIRMARSRAVPDEHVSGYWCRNMSCSKCYGANTYLRSLVQQADKRIAELSAPTPPAIPKERSRDRAATEPGGVQCQKCGYIFIGEEWHSVCGVCFATPCAEQPEPSTTIPNYGDPKLVASISLRHKLNKAADVVSPFSNPNSRTHVDTTSAELEMWRPIETAPKDFTEIDIWNGERIPNCSWGQTTYGRQVGFVYQSDYDSNGPVIELVRDPTHWMPLPAPPSTKLATD